jgi:hypothetical protein
MRTHTVAGMAAVALAAGCGSDGEEQPSRPTCYVDFASSGDYATEFSREYECPISYVMGADEGRPSIHMPQDDFGEVTDAAPTTPAGVSVRLFGLAMDTKGTIPAGVMAQPRVEGIPQLWASGWDTGDTCEADVESVTSLDSADAVVTAAVSCSAALAYQGQVSTLQRFRFRAVVMKLAL